MGAEFKPEEQKFFAAIRPDIAQAESAKIRKELIEGLPQTDPVIHRMWSECKRQIDSTCHLLSASGLLRFAGDGNLNTYRVFTEISSKLLSVRGRAGMVVQTGLATDESAKELFHYLLSEGRLTRFLDFENKQAFFTDVHAQFRFGLVTLAGGVKTGTPPEAEFGWLLHTLEEMQKPGRLIRLSAGDLLLFNPTSKTCPVFVSQNDLEISRRIYRNGIHIYLGTSQRLGEIDFLGELFNLTRDSRYFISRGAEAEIESLPLYEAKYLHQFDHRFATTSQNHVVDSTPEEKGNPGFHAKTSRVVDAKEVRTRLTKRSIGSRWLVGFRDISSATNERTSIMAVFPVSAVGNSINMVLGLDAKDTAFLTANANCFVFDYCCRQKVSGTHVNIWIFKQLPAIPLDRQRALCPWSGAAQTFRDWLLPRVLELTYTAWDLEAFAQDCGWSGPPFRWDEERRFLLRCELDAAFFHLYLGPETEWRQQPEALTQAFPTPRHAVAYIMDTFPIVKRKDEAEVQRRLPHQTTPSSKSTTPSPTPCKPASPTKPASIRHRLTHAAAIRLVTHNYEEPYVHAYQRR